jgi:nicotinamide-nucleotide amidase
MFEPALTDAASQLIDLCRRKRLWIATAESCTGGLIAGLITSVAGSSDVFDSGFVTYSNAAKTAMIGVPEEMITRCGAVSEDVARAMAQGALRHSQADITVAVTGIAGPGGGSGSKPVGLVHCAAATRSGDFRHLELRLGDIGRDAVRLATVEQAIELAYALALASDEP